MENEKLVELFEEYLSIYKLVNRKTICDLLKSELHSEQLIEMYKMTDGSKSTREISADIKNKCSHATVSNTWNKWALVGIVSPTSKKGRVKAVFDLEEYGITAINSEGE